MKKIFYWKSGFSIIEAMIAAGLIAAAALAMIKVNQLQIDLAKSNELSVRLDNVSDRVAILMSNSLACENTLKGRSLKNVDKLDLTHILDMANNDAYVKGLLYEDRYIKINSISLTSFSNAPKSVLSELETRDASLVINFSKLKIRNKLKDVIKLNKTFPVKIKINDKLLIQECSSSDLELEKTAIKETCQALGGTYIKPFDCDYSASNSKNSFSAMACVAMNGVYDSIGENCVTIPEEN